MNLLESLYDQLQIGSTLYSLRCPWKECMPVVHFQPIILTILWHYCFYWFPNILQNLKSILLNFSFPYVIIIPSLWLPLPSTFINEGLRYNNTGIQQHSYATTSECLLYTQYSECLQLKWSSVYYQCVLITFRVWIWIYCQQHWASI